MSKRRVGHKVVEGYALTPAPLEKFISLSFKNNCVNYTQTI